MGTLHEFGITLIKSFQSELNIQTIACLGFASARGCKHLETFRVGASLRGVRGGGGAHQADLS